MVAMLVFQNKEMAAMMVYQTTGNLPVIELYFCASAFFCLNSNPIWLLVPWVKNAPYCYQGFAIKKNSFHDDSAYIQKYCKSDT